MIAPSGARRIGPGCPSDGEATVRPKRLSVDPAAVGPGEKVDRYGDALRGAEPL